MHFLIPERAVDYPKEMMKIIVDCGNGVAGAFAPTLYRDMGCQVEELFCEVDGNFPNHHPDPSQPMNLQDLIAALKSSDAEIGLAFDGDGDRDRLGVVTKDGSIIFPDRQLMLFADEADLQPIYFKSDSCQLDPLFDEQTRRLWAAAEAQVIGRSGVSLVARATGLSRTTIHQGIKDLSRCMKRKP